MKLAVVVVLALGTFACGGKKSSPSTSPTPTMKGTDAVYGGTTYGGATYGGNTYGGATYGGAR
jgi:hypothetical protein